MSLALPRAVLFTSALAALCGCGPAIRNNAASLAASSTPVEDVTFVAANTMASSPLKYIGRKSCSATACHGEVHTEPATWRNAYSRWEAADPHRRAFEVLYTERSVRMFRNINSSGESSINEADYLRFLEENCIGCHATPPARSSQARFEHQTNPDVYWQGVSCESCHGAASGWLDRHYLQSWTGTAGLRQTEMTSSTGFQDTRQLDQRAEVCMQCHLGPQQMGERQYDVNHDLIAAGHPRLTFELHAYLANLPKHWDEAQEHSRHEAAKQKPGSSPSFHFDAWRAGQIQQVKQETVLRQARSDAAAKRELGEWAEFANQDCRACHHGIGEPIYASRRDQFRIAEKLAQAPVDLSIPERAGVLRTLLPPQLSAQQSPPLSADQATDVYLAMAAFVHDLPDGALSTELRHFQQAIADQAGSTQYDLPTRFNPQQQQFRAALFSLDVALQKLQQ